MTSCADCKRAFGATTETVTCNGFCEAIFHFTCSGMDRPAFKAYKNNSNILWFCNSCLEMLINRSYKVDPAPSTPPVTTEPNEFIAMEFQKLSAEISSNRKLIEDLAMLIQPVPVQTPKISEPVWRAVGTPLNSGKRRAVEELVPATRSQPICGTKNVNNAGLKIIPSKFWLHLSKFETAMSENEVSVFVSEYLNCNANDIQCVKLVPKGRDIATMKYVAYKAGIDLNMEQLALTPSTWPFGLYVRPFKDYGSNFQPRIFSRPVIPSIATSLTQPAAESSTLSEEVVVEMD